MRKLLFWSIALLSAHVAAAYDQIGGRPLNQWDAFHVPARSPAVEFAMPLGLTVDFSGRYAVDVRSLFTWPPGSRCCHYEWTNISEVVLTDSGGNVLGTWAVTHSVEDNQTHARLDYWTSSRVELAAGVNYILTVKGRGTGWNSRYPALFWVMVY